MVRIITFLLFTLIMFGCNNDPENNSSEAGKTSRHSAAFNTAADSVLKNYYDLSELFVKWDSANVNSAAEILRNSLDKLSMEMDTATGTSRDNLLKGSVHYEKAVTAAGDIPNMHDLTSKRHKFHELSENLFRFLQLVQYDNHEVFLQECTMPFNDTGRGVWLSHSEEKRNPYLGLHHPYYKSGMLECGTLEGKIDYSIKEN